jgi:hypothetical protein
MYHHNFTKKYAHPDPIQPFPVDKNAISQLSVLDLGSAIFTLLHAIL